MDLILIKMLRINYRYRGSISDYLEEFYYLGFHEILTVDIRRITLIGKTAG